MTITSDLPEHFVHYIGLVKGDDIWQAFDHQTPLDTQFYESITEEQSNGRYAPGKWTIKEVLQHCVDTERIFIYRALAIARGETSALPGFDAAPYTANSHANDRKWSDLVAEFKNLRRSTIDFVESLNHEDLAKTGRTSEYGISVEEMLFTTVGHNLHHIHIIQEKYLN